MYSTADRSILEPPSDPYPVYAVLEQQPRYKNYSGQRHTNTHPIHRVTSFTHHSGTYIELISISISMFSD